ncbi:hypothetical protein [Asaia platycodi]|uniref:hypothetical protein n=1 Tax=Asaia platycodi TaxID=610243 RepID=UPI001F58BF28|nr:hypothetical protein [Asaia platycodi]
MSLPRISFKALGVVTTALATFSAIPVAQAQSPLAGGAPNGTGLAPSVRVSSPIGTYNLQNSSVPPLPHPEAIFDDPWGWNTWLRQHGVAILLDTTNEFAGAITSRPKVWACVREAAMPDSTASKTTSTGKSSPVSVASRPMLLLSVVTASLPAACSVTI